MTSPHVDGRLWAEAAFISRTELLPESETVFFSRDSGTRVTLAGEGGRVKALVAQGARAEKVE
jgi:hypothetical protein